MSQSERSIGIVGLGLIGGSVGLAARAAGWHVLGYDPVRETRFAAEGHAVDRAVLDPLDLCECDVVFVAVPPPATVEALGVLRHACSVITDCASVKGPIAEWASQQPEDALRRRLVPGHPMAGHERGGLEHARADLFSGAPWLLTPTDHTDPRATELVEATVRGFRAAPKRLDAREHDRIVARVSHLTHAVASALVHVAGDDAEFGGGSWRDGTRVAGATPAMWRDILLMNRREAGEALEALIAQLETVLSRVRSGDAEGLESYWDEARNLKHDMQTRRG